jgi:hypothetical protein
MTAFASKFARFEYGAALASRTAGRAPSAYRWLCGVAVMSVAPVGSSTSAYSYLQSLLPSAGSGATDPVSQLLQAFYPSGQSDPLTARASGSGTNAAATTDPLLAGPSGFNFSPDTMSALISLQGQLGGDPSLTTQSQSLFSQFDANGNGQISQSEFENAFGSNADTSKVDGLFNALDSNSDGSVSQDELTSAAQQSHAAHHHHHHAHGGGGGQGGGGGGLSDLLSSTDATGATTKTLSNADGSTTTSITYADGSTVDMTAPAASSGGSNASGGSTGNNQNLLEQLIRIQSQFLTPATGQSLATI